MQSIPPSNQLLSCCNPIFNRLTPFCVETHGKNLAQNYRDIFLADITELEHKANKMQIASITIQHMKYAMTALIDEIILHSSWEGSIEWLGQPLQLYFFSEHLAGEGFFTRLEMLRLEPNNNCDLLEVYYVCLQLGFAGIYCIKGKEFLQGLQVGLYQQISAARLQQNIKSPKNALLKQSFSKRSIPELSIKSIGCATVLVIFFIYMSYLLAIDRKADQAVQAIEIYRNSI